MTDSELLNSFPHAAAIMQRVVSDPELSQFLDALTDIWRESAKVAVETERDRCAKIAEDLYLKLSPAGITGLRAAVKEIVDGIRGIE